MALNRTKRRLRNIVLGAIVLYILIGSFLYAFQESMIFHPWDLPQDHTYEFQHDFEELFLRTEEDAVINALHFKAENSKGVILYFHGNAGHLQRWGAITSHLIDKGYDLFIIDYRTFGKSKGELSEEALYHDAQFCYDYLVEKYATEDIIIYGRSLGSGVASKLASENKASHLILESPFYSLADVAKTRFPIFPVERLLKYELPNYKNLQKVDYPITIFHGTSDFVVPYSSGEKLKESLNGKEVKLITIEGGGHSDLSTFSEYHEGVKEILQ